MFKSSSKREVLETSKEILKEARNQNDIVKIINKKQIDSSQKKELKQELTLKEGDLKKKIIIRKKKVSKSFRHWLFNNYEL